MFISDAAADDVRAGEGEAENVPAEAEVVAAEVVAARAEVLAAAVGEADDVLRRVPVLRPRGLVRFRMVT